MEQITTKPENKWILQTKTDEELKQIAKDLYNGKIFSDRHLSQYDRIESHFMVILFMGPQNQSLQNILLRILTFKVLVITNFMILFNARLTKKNTRKN